MGNPFGGHKEFASGVDRVSTSLRDTMADQIRASEGTPETLRLMDRSRELTGDTLYLTELQKELGYTNYGAITERLERTGTGVQKRKDEIKRAADNPGAKATILTRAAQAQGPLGSRMK